MNRSARTILGVLKTTGIAPDERLEKERSLLAGLPRRRLDTAYVEVRRVHVAVPQIEW